LTPNCKDRPYGSRLPEEGFEQRFQLRMAVFQRSIHGEKYCRGIAIASEQVSYGKAHSLTLRDHPRAVTARYTSRSEPESNPTEVIVVGKSKGQPAH
jgi:hypothetical protein